MIGVVVAAIIASAQPLTPSEAAAVLERLESPSNIARRPICTDCDGPRVFIIPSSPTSGPFGSFPEYRFNRPLNCCGLYRGRYGLRVQTPRPFGVVGQVQRCEGMVVREFAQRPERRLDEAAQHPRR